MHAGLQYSQKLKLFFIFIISLTLWTLMLALLSSIKVSAYNPLTDQEARDTLTAKCLTLPASTQTIHLIYLEASSFSQTNDTITTYLKGISHRCSSATKAATGVGQTLNSVSTISGTSINNITAPNTMYSAVTLGIGAFSSPVRSGPYSISTVTAGYNSIRYDYTAYSLGTSGVGWDYISFNAGDVCTNLPGLQWPGVPPGYTKAGGNCNIAVVGCTDSSALNYNSFATKDDGSCKYPVAVVSGCTNSSALNYRPSATKDDGSCIYPKPGCTDSSATNYIPSANVNDGSCIYDVCNNLAGTQLSIPLGYSSNGGGGCIYPPPSCGPPNNSSVSAGLSFVSKKLFRNGNSLVMPVSGVSYSIGTVVPSTTATPGSVSIAAGKTSDFSSSAHIINSPGIYTITWKLIYEFGTKDCSDNITVTVVEPTCSASNFSIGTSDKLVPKVTVDNSNYVPLNITSASYVTSPVKISGAAITGSAPGRVKTTFDALETTIDTAGEYVLTWTVQWNVGSSSGAVKCKTDKSTVSNQPYARFYGNDIFAGGGFGESCSSAGAFDARGYGRNSTSDTYLGTASELAVFAIGQIQNVLPGSQRSRSSAPELAFANIASGPIQVDSAIGKFGGGFGSVMCSPDYYSKSSTVDKKLDTTIDLSTLESGSYSYGSGNGSNIKLSTGNIGIPDGNRLIIYIDGNVQISSLGNSRFGYANSAGNWGSVSDIPSVYIVASGNIFVQNDIATIDGIYVAQPRDDATKGEIYTCANGVDDPLDGLSDRSTGGDAEFLSSKCNRKLTVNGAFIAKRVHLLRSVGTVNSSVPYESAGSAGIAEVFRFSPELFLTEGGGLPPRSTNVKIDSIVALPPSF